MATRHLGKWDTPSIFQPLGERLTATNLTCRALVPTLRKPVYNGRPLSRSLHHKVAPEDQGAVGEPEYIPLAILALENPSNPSWCKENHLLPGSTLLTHALVL
jgi:hypothetical protein